MARQRLAAGQGELDLGLDDSPDAGGPLEITGSRMGHAAANRIDFLELLADQYMDMPERKRAEARELATEFPVVLHSVDLSIGTDQPPDTEYVAKIREVAEWTQPAWISDHLCFTRVPGINLGRLTPLALPRRWPTSLRVTYVP